MLAMTIHKEQIAPVHGHNLPRTTEKRPHSSSCEGVSSPSATSVMEFSKLHLITYLQSFRSHFSTESVCWFTAKHANKVIKKV